MPSHLSHIPLLDHGYLVLIESWGSERSIIESARMSTAKGFLGWGPQCTECGVLQVENSDSRHESSCSKPTTTKEGDEKLLRYLWKNKHTTPFEMAGMTIEVQAPIFVFREWMRHRTQSFSELSARYTPLPDVNYVPSVERLMLGSDGKNKQAGTIPGSSVLTEVEANLYIHRLKALYSSQEELYQESLRYGVPKELARIHLPVGRYSRMRASANLLNWLRFLSLRLPENAQYEIRVYAEALGTLVSRFYPRVWSCFQET